MTISRNQFESLASATGDHLITICMPTHRRGRDTEQDPIRLRNLLGELEQRCAARNIEPEALTGLRRFVEGLQDDGGFWRHRGDGLILYARPGEADIQVETLDHEVESLVTVGERFCVRPLLPAVEEDEVFFILAISRNTVRLLRCDRQSAQVVDADSIPTSIADALGHDWEQKSLQFHSGAPPVGKAGTTRAAAFHGHGRATASESDEIDQFLRRVDRGLNEHFRNERHVVIVAAVKEEADHFRAVSHYPRVLEATIAGSPEHRSASELHAEGVSAMSRLHDESARRRREGLQDRAHTEKVVSGVEDVVAAVGEARVDTLFVDPKVAVWGAARRDDAGTWEVRVHGERQAVDADLVNLAICRCVGTGGEVVVASSRDLPERQPMAALVRY